MSQFDRLPALLVGKILGYLKDSEYRKFRTVCTKWDESFRSNIGLELTVSNINWEILEQEVNRSGKLSRLCLKDVTMPLGKFIKFPGRIALTSLVFERIIPTYNVIWSINFFRNLKSLSFNLVRLESKEFKMRQLNSLCLPLLESISIVTTTGSGIHILTAEELLSGIAIMDFLSNIECNKLKMVTILCPEEFILHHLKFEQLFDPNCKLTEMPGLIRLLYRNCSTLQRFVAGSSPSNILLKSQFKPVNVFWRTHMQLICFDSYFNFPTDWDILFHTQNVLQFIRANGAYRHWSSLQIAISKSCASLVKVYLAGGGFGSSVSLFGFEGCTKLETLEIFLDDCYLEDISNLPKSLKNLSLNGPLQQDDLEVISYRLENLEELLINNNLPSTRYLYYGNNLVVTGHLTRSLVEDFLTLPLIRSLTFRNCRIEVDRVTSWLESIDGVDVIMYPVAGFPRNTHGSMRIQIISRQLHE